MGRIDPAQQPAIESVPLSSTLVPAERRARHLRKPWSSIQSLGFVGQVDLLVPRSCADAVQRKLAEREAATAQPQYARVVMTLGQVLEGAFFKEYIKAGGLAVSCFPLYSWILADAAVGHILMLSKGRPGQDNVFSLKDGRLTLFLERETYERAGLDGKPHGVKDSRGLRPRWVVEIDLNAKAMWPGKAGYERVVYACKNVLNKPVTWLLCNKFDSRSTIASGYLMFYIGLIPASTQPRSARRLFSRHHHRRANNHGADRLATAASRAPRKLSRSRR